MKHGLAPEVLMRVLGGGGAGHRPIEGIQATRQAFQNIVHDIASQAHAHLARAKQLTVGSSGNGDGGSSISTNSSAESH